ncbi:flagellar motor protein [Inmirania thermothiophila]|uniref:Chemotaxis protein MotA n=1 Tax=Inmirania thermothiophila TaxID=1750597 RepID=A0A3N1Y8X6_9GAMM|nr:flagellar motor protein [Inmirania thermothiophila]ROR34948.1 chemotaxis protein MotA [Inmirania thermothiophila]
MDVLSLIGVLLALVAIVGGNLLEGGHTGSLLQLTAFVIVIGGTTGAILLQTPLPVFVRALGLAGWVLVPPRRDGGETIERIVGWSQVARRDGLLGLEGAAEAEADPFVRKGLQLLVDGAEPEAIRAALEVELEAREQRDLQAARVFEAAGGYSPTIGIIGAVMGLIHVMQNLADPSRLGEGIATAFVATIYGVGAANLLLLPMANKLKALIGEEARHREMIIEGIVAIAEGENPRNIEARLQGFLA